MKSIKIIIFALLCVMPLLFSCEKSNQQQPEPDREYPNLIITSGDTVYVGIDGGVCEVLYEIENPVEGKNVEVVVNANIDWIENIDVEEQGKILLTVASNEEAPREVYISVKYDIRTVDVILCQSGVENVTMSEFIGYYYGAEGDSDAANYYFYIGNKEFNGIMMAPDAVYYRIDLYAGVSENPARAFVPEGTYELGNGEMGTFTEELSCMISVDASAMSVAYDYESGTLVVTRDGDNWNYDLTVSIGGNIHHVVYNGPVMFEDYSPSEEWKRPEGDYSAVTQDMTIEPESISARYTGFEDGGDLVIDFIDGNMVLSASFFVEKTDGVLEPGKYNASGLHMPGTLEYGGATIFFGMVLESGSYLKITDVDSQVETFGFISGGYIEIDQVEADEYYFNIDLEMEGKYSLTGTYQGVVEIASGLDPEAVPGYGKLK